jgi:hypothetical protein
MNSFTTVFLIDLDGTIIGDISQQIMSYELWKGLKISSAKYSFDLMEFREKLRNGIIRPGFETFIKTMKQHFGNVEFFVYTASEKSWADFVIKQIEHVTDIRFNRPIFSREHCVQQDREYKKSVSFVKKQISRCISKKFNQQAPVSIKSLLIIDNNNVYGSHDQKYILLCPSYNFRVPENIICNIKQKCYEEHYQKIHSIVRKYVSTPMTPTKDYMLFQKEFYSYYVYFINAIAKSNVKYSKDTFWWVLKDIILTENIQSFNEKNIRMLNRYVRREHASP